MVRKKDERVVVAMSGGVDSSVAAAILREEGYDVIGITMQLWPSYLEAPENPGGCCSLQAVDDARRVAEHLGIPYYVLNFQELFSEEVIHDFCLQYSAGRTPNPCIRCNERVKFQALLTKALGFGADFLATGHYARVSKVDERFHLLRSADPSKDQTYALYRFTQWQLAHILFPLGHMTKSETRRKALKLGISVAQKKDSQEICFVTRGDYRTFLKEHFPQCLIPGQIEDRDGDVLGSHNGLALYTIGQRKGLGISSRRPLYVIDLDVERNVVVVGPAEELLCTRFSVEDENFIPFDRLPGPMEVTVKIRYNAPEAPALIVPGENGELTVELKVPQRAVTPGQSAVFYNDDLVIGGGIIKRRLG
jgi:tRNA-specific 2-thiouridylase